MKFRFIAIGLTVLIPFGAALAQSSDPSAVKPQKTVTPKYPEQIPVLNGIRDLFRKVDIARAHGKVTNQQAVDLEKQINAVHAQMTAFKREDHKTIHSDHMTQEQISTLMSMLEKVGQKIPD